MKIYIGERCSGKTTKLIKESAKTGYTIVVANRGMADCVVDQAKRMGLAIPTPLTIRQCNSGALRGRHVEGILIDELDMVFDVIFNNIPVEGVTVTDAYLRGSVKVEYLYDQRRKIHIKKWFKGLLKNDRRTKKTS